MKNTLFGALVLPCLTAAAQQSGVSWKHLSRRNGDLELPNNGTEKTSCVVYDVDRNDINDFIVTERTQALTVVWYRRNDKGWKK